MVVRRQATVGFLIRIVMLSADGHALGSKSKKSDKFRKVRLLTHTYYQVPRNNGTNVKDAC